MTNPKDEMRALAGHKNLRDADLRGADLRGADLRDTDLRGADLENADLTGVNLRGAKLKGAKLKGVGLRGAELSALQIFHLSGGLTLEQKTSLKGSTSMKKGDILSSRTNPETYRVVSVRLRGGKLTVNIVNTKNKKRYSKRVYQGSTIIGSGVLFYVRGRAGDVFFSR